MAVRAAFSGYFRFSFKLSPIPFLPLFPMGLWVCRGLNCPRLYPKAFLCFILLSLGHSPPRLGLLDSPRVNGLGPLTIGPHNSPQNPAVRPLGWKGGFW